MKWIEDVLTRDEHLRPALEINILKLCLPVGSPHFNSMTALETERKYPISGEKLGGDSTAKPTLSPPILSGHSHSIVPGGLDVTSYTTRLTPFTSLMIRVAVSPRNFISNG